MPSLNDMKDLLEDDRVITVFTGPRPEAVNLRTSEGTKERMKNIMESGIGSSLSEVAHIALQVGLYSLEETFVKVQKE